MRNAKFSTFALLGLLAVLAGCAGSEEVVGGDTEESYGVSGAIETTGPASKDDGIEPRSKRILGQ